MPHEASCHPDCSTLRSGPWPWKGKFFVSYVLFCILLSCAQPDLARPPWIPVLYDSDQVISDQSLLGMPTTCILSHAFSILSGSSLLHIHGQDLKLACQQQEFLQTFASTTNVTSMTFLAWWIVSSRFCIFVLMVIPAHWHTPFHFRSSWQLMSAYPLK